MTFVFPSTVTKKTATDIYTMANDTRVLLEPSISDTVLNDAALTKEVANQLFHFFKECSVFIWQNSSNDCEDRANAICMLLDKWGVGNYKGWVFSGAFLKKDDGCLKNLWNYHVAALLPVKEGGDMKFYIID